VILHVVLFRPKPALGKDPREALFAALRSAAATIPSVRRFTVGRGIENPPAYVQSGFPDFPFAAIVTFDDRAGLLEYLAHPAHADLGRLFNETLEAALIYDYETAEAAGVAGLFDEEERRG
jgi:hypothetical protein